MQVCTYFTGPEFNFSSHSCLIWFVVVFGNFKNFKKHFKLDLTEYNQAPRLKSESLFLRKITCDDVARAILGICEFNGR